MSQIERLIILCFLISKSLDVEKVAEFVNVLEAGCLSHQRDSLKYKEDILKAARKTPLAGDFGELVRTMLQVYYLDRYMEKLSARERNVDAVITLLGTKSTLRLGEKAMLSRMARLLDGRRRH